MGSAPRVQGGASPHPQPPKAPARPAASGGRHSGRSIRSPRPCPLAGPRPEAAARLPLTWPGRGAARLPPPEPARSARPPPQLFVSPRRAAPHTAPADEPGKLDSSGRAPDAACCTQGRLRRAPRTGVSRRPPPGTRAGKTLAGRPARRKEREDKDGSCPAPFPHPTPAWRRDSRRGGRAHLGPGPAGLVLGNRNRSPGSGSRGAPAALGPGKHTDSRARPGPAGSEPEGSGPPAGRAGDREAPLRPHPAPRAALPPGGSGARAARRGRDDRALLGPARGCEGSGGTPARRPRGKPHLRGEVPCCLPHCRPPRRGMHSRSLPASGKHP